MPALHRREGRVVTIEIGGRNALNPINHDTYVNVCRLLQELDDQPDVGAAVLRGHGDRHFSAGGDMVEIAEAGDAARADPVGHVRAVFEAMWFPHLGPHHDPQNASGYFREHAMNYRRRTLTPVVAAIQGQCLGAGLVIVGLHSCYRIAGASAMLGMAEIKLGMAGGLALSDLANQLSPRAIALLLTGESLDAHTALEVGLVNEVVADDAVFDRASTVAARMAEMPRLAALAERRAMEGGSGSLGRRAAWGALTAALRGVSDAVGVAR